MRKLVPILLLLTVAIPLQAAESPLGRACAVHFYNTQQVRICSGEHQAAYDGQTYYFAGQGELEQFKVNPAKYVPVLGGRSIVCWENMRRFVPGKTAFSIKHKNRVYLFPGRKDLEAFRANAKKYEMADLPLECYCPVYLLDQKRLVQGKASWTSLYDGLRYVFPGAGPKARFDANPARYVPAFAGNCVVCYKDSKQLVKGTIRYGVFHRGRSYLLPSAAARANFMKNPRNYATVDLANEGRCVVCEKRDGRSIMGLPDHQTIHNGLLYRFPAITHRALFERDPVRYAMPSPLDLQRAPGSGTTASMPLPRTDNKPDTRLTPKERTEPPPSAPRQPLRINAVLSAEGTTACAGCDYGKRPVADPNSLGLAVVTTDKVYIVDRAEKLYPKIFTNRFEELPVKIRGTVKKIDGKFVWLEPQAVLEAR